MINLHYPSAMAQSNCIPPLFREQQRATRCPRSHERLQCDLDKQSMSANSRPRSRPTTSPALTRVDDWEFVDFPDRRLRRAPFLVTAARSASFVSWLSRATPRPRDGLAHHAIGGDAIGRRSHLLGGPHHRPRQGRRCSRGRCREGGEASPSVLRCFATAPSVTKSRRRTGVPRGSTSSVQPEAVSTFRHGLRGRVGHRATTGTSSPASLGTRALFVPARIE